MADKPQNPKLALALSVLPGFGHVFLGLPFRGLKFLLFIILLGWLSHHLMPPHAGFFGRNIGGIFVWGLSILDAYKVARIRQLS